MKFSIFLLASLLIASCLGQDTLQHFALIEGCDPLTCVATTITYENNPLSIACPTPGYNMANLEAMDSQLILTLTFNNIQVNQLLETVSDQPYSYMSQLDEHSFIALFNCQYEDIVGVTDLCIKHRYVIGKYIDNVFQKSCAFGLVPVVYGIYTPVPDNNI